jgi:phytanoyl-CoA hydroxylase
MSAVSDTARKFETHVPDGIEPHRPDLYTVDAIAPKVIGAGAIDDDAVAFYHEHGYLAVEQLIPPDDVQEVTAALLDLIAGKVEGYNGLQPEGQLIDRFEAMQGDARADAIRKLWNLCPWSPRLKAFSADERIMGPLQRLLGGPAQLFQDMAMLKPPRQGREKPWHQDKAYFDLPIGTPVVGVWIALDEATTDNGCMHVLDGGHRDGPVVHFKKRDWQICDTDILARKRACVAVPLKPGGVLFFDGLLPHGTPTNHSDQRRRAVQFHYAPADAVKIAQEERLKVFGSEGKDVSC